MKKLLINCLPYATACALGCLLTLAFAPYNAFPLAILAPAGLLALWLNVDSWKAFKLGFIFGVALYSTSVYWIFHSVHIIGGVPIPIAILITAAFISILSFYTGLTGWAIAYYFPYNTTTKFIFAFPAVWVLTDWFRGLLFTGFPWLFIGYSQINSPLRGYAAALSVYGVSIATLMTSGLLVYAIVSYRQKNYRSLYQALLFMVLLWAGGVALNMAHWTSPQGKPKTVALIQGNIPQSLKWSPAHLQLSFDRYQELTQPLLGKVNIIIWPEAAIPVPLDYATDFIDKLNEQAVKSGSQIILGIPIGKADGSAYYNSVVTLGTNQQRYDKRHLVPFGEYMPTIPLVNKTMTLMNIPLPNSTYGSMAQRPLNVEDTQILTTICYEIAYPELVRSTVIEDPKLGFLLTVTNDAWFGKSNAQAQHLQIARMRALEFGRPVVFVSNDGITAIIDANGNITASAPQYETYVLKGEVQPMQGLTPWMMDMGNSGFKYIILVFLFFSIHASYTKRRELRKQQAAMDIAG